jgi:cold shock protein
MWLPLTARLTLQSSTVAQRSEAMSCQATPQVFRGFEFTMAEGTIKKVTQKGFGFIDTGRGKDLFFHSSSLEGVTFEQLYEGQRVSYTEGRGDKGPRAENVKLI